MNQLDGMRIMGPDDGPFIQNPRSVSRELVTAAETGDRWRLGEVTARPDEARRRAQAERRRQRRHPPEPHIKGSIAALSAAAASHPIVVGEAVGVGHAVPT